MLMWFLRREVCNPGQSVGLILTVRGEGYIGAVAAAAHERAAISHTHHLQIRLWVHRRRNHEIMVGIEILDQPVGSEPLSEKIDHACGSSFKFGTLPTSIPSTHRHRMEINAVPPSGIRGAEGFAPFVAAEEYKNVVFLQNASSSLLPSSLL